MPDQRQRGEAVLTDRDAGGVVAGIQVGLDAQTSPGASRGDRLDNDVVAGQRPATPVVGDVGEQPVVKSARGAVSSFDRAVSPEPLPAPGVPLSRHRALHKSRSTMDSCLHPVVGQGEGMTVPRYR